MTDFEIYAGEDFALRIQAVEEASDSPIDLTLYEIIAQISTTSTGNRIVASTIDDKGVTINRRSDSEVAVNISHTLTSQLSEGVIMLTVILIHKQSGARIIAEKRTVNIKRSKFIEQ